MINQAGTTVVIYVFPLLQSDLAPNETLGYTISFTGNSTFTGTYIYGVLSGNNTMYGFAGISGSPYYSLFPETHPNKITVMYVVPETSSSPYVIGAANSYDENQNVTLSHVDFASCGDTWISQISVI